MNPDGSFFALNTPSGTSVTVTRTGPGTYSFSASGLGNGCPIPIITPEATPVGITFGGGGCSSGSVTTTVFTADGQDHDWAFTVVGTDPPGGAAATRLARSALRKSFPR